MAERPSANHRRGHAPPAAVPERGARFPASPTTDATIAGDAVLIQKAKANPAAFTALYHKYVKAVYNYIWYRVRHQDAVAEDLTQEVFVRAYEQLPSFEWRGYPYLTYLYRTAHNVLINYFKSAHRRLEVPDPLDTLDVPFDVAPALEDRLALQSLWRAVQGLAEDQKSALLLYYRQGKPVEEIAHILGKSVNAVKLLLSRARKRLRAHVDLHQMATWRDTPREHPAPRFSRAGNTPRS